MGPAGTQARIWLYMAIRTLFFYLFMFIFIYLSIYLFIWGEPCVCSPFGGRGDVRTCILGRWTCIWGVWPCIFVPGLVFLYRDMHVGCLDLYELYLGCLDLYFVRLDWYLWCLDLCFGCLYTCRMWLWRARSPLIRHPPSSPNEAPAEFP